MKNKRKHRLIFGVIIALCLITTTPVITALYLDDLEDVIISNPYHDQFLRYNSTNANWTNINYTATGDGYAGDKGHPHNQDLNITSDAIFSSVTGAKLNSGLGFYELYAMNQDVETTDAVTFLTLNTGFGANELYDMNQNVLTSSDVQFDNAGFGASAQSDPTKIYGYYSEEFSGSSFEELLTLRLHHTGEVYPIGVYLRQKFELTDSEYTGEAGFTIGRESAENDYTFFGFSTKGALGLNVAVRIDSDGYLGVGDTSPDYRVELPNVAGVSGRGRANDWTTYSDERFKHFLGEMPVNKVIQLYDLISIQYYNPIDNYQDENGTIHIGEINYSKYGVGINAQELYQSILDAGFSVNLANQIVYKPENELIDYWSVSYNKIIMILIEGARLKIEDLENRIEIIEDLLGIG